MIGSARAIVAGLLLAGALFGGGCIAQPKLTQYSAVECLKKSMVYQNLARDAGGPIELAVNRDADNLIQIVVLAHRPDARVTLGRFRADPDGRMFQYDVATQRWTWITTCD